MTLQPICTGLFVFAVLVALIAILWGIIRSTISEFRTRGWQSRLSQPRLEEVEAKWGVRLPRVLEEFYRSGAAEQSEFYLTPPNFDSRQRWYISRFIPLTVLDISEWLYGSMIPGIPIALDGGKGFYYLPFEALRGSGTCPVLHRDLGAIRPFADTEVALSVEEIVRFKAVEPSDDEDDELDNSDDT